MIRPSVPVSTDIVLVGGGHAHVAVLRRFGMKPEPGVRLTLIARDVETPYSGMIPGYFAGHYTRPECHIDLVRLARFAGARLVHASATGLDLAARRVHVDGGRPPVAYDLLSLDTGSTPDAGAIAGAAEHAVAVKPIDGLLAAVAQWEHELAHGTAPFRLAFIGAGAGGTELAMALQYRFGVVAGACLSVVLVDASPTIVPTHNAAARRALFRALGDRGIETALGHPVRAIGAGRIERDGVPAIAFDRAILVTGAGAPAWSGASGLAVDDRGFVRVATTLRSISHAGVFAAGDLATVEGHALPKSGVYAVRAGPVLADNLRRAATGQALRPWTPQRHALALVSTGDRSAVASRAGLAFNGPAMWRLKDWIDRRWMRRYQQLPAMGGGTRAGGEAALAQMRCGGCGAKISASVLRRALARLPAQARADVFAGLDAPDDAAIIAPPPPGEVLVQTVDQFRAFVDDPYLFGRIAALHCLADIWAMGARPRTALATVVLPDGPAAKQEEDLAALLGGAAAALAEAGAVLVGGHTGEGAELAFGLAVTGHAAPDRLLRKGGLVPGDAIVLTKPLGTGIVLAADMRARAEAAWVKATMDSMLRPVGPAAAVLAAHGVRAATDVTGFGLAGHLGEMLSASGVDAVLDLAALPALPGSRALLREGIESTLATANRAAMYETTGDLTAPGAALLVDPQTSGGLIAGVPFDRAPACLAALHAAGDPYAAVIGRVVARSGMMPCITMTV
ncbi:MAG: selenide, water dikinase SelD [Alphaproteobacteria bacterium]|nr:selenide, water dikinase SelD [Alphaproteobacteria bacterium]